MKRTTAAIALCILLGAASAGPGVAAASGVLAERSAQAVYVDGRRVELEAYNIGGSNYVKLRDIGQAVDFNVYWDCSAVRIDSGSPYTGESPPGTTAEAESADYSAAANPGVFTGVFTREAYNATYGILLALKSGDDTHRGAIHIENQEDRWRYEEKLAHLANGYTLSLRGKSGGIYEVYAHKVDKSAADVATADLIRAAKGLGTDKEKVRLLNDYLCGRVIYDAKKSASINEIATSSEPVYANCGSLADAMNYLCGKLDIPCFNVHGENHFWNYIYCDGAWSYTDVSLNAQVPGHDYFLFSPTARKQNTDPEGTRFLQELLVPGSMK